MSEITQADRDAAADFYCDWFATGDNNENVKDIRSGARDALPHVQAFARHREQAEQETVAKIVAWLRDGFVRDFDQKWRDQLCTAIEAGEWK